MQNNQQVTKSHNSLAFNTDGSLTSDGLKACQLMQIDPASLQNITEQDLINQGVEAHIAKVRVEHLQEKRHERVQMLENTIRSGMLAQLANVIQIVQNKNPKVAKQHVSNIQSRSYSGSENKIDIPLRDPLDPEYRLNRKLAKQIYNKEKIERVIQHKEELQMTAQQILEKKQKDEKKQEKIKEDLRRNKIKDFKAKIENDQIKRDSAKMKFKQEEKLLLSELEEKRREIIKKEQQKKQEQELQELKRQKQRFQTDLENLEKQQSKKGELAQKLAQEEEVVRNNLRLFEEKIKKHEEMQYQQVQNISEHAQQFTKNVEVINKQWKDTEYFFNLENVYKSFKSVLNSEKLKRDHLKKQIEKIKQNRDDKLLSAKEKHKLIQGDEKEKFRYLQDRQNQRNSLIREVKEAFNEEIDQKKEISQLKKKDQLENYERGKNFHYLYKQKLIERLLEKKERAERVKDQQRRIASMCATQRVRVSRAIENAAAQIVHGEKKTNHNQSAAKTEK